MTRQNKQVERDLSDLTIIMEDFVANLPKLTEPEKIDLAARIKPVAKACESIDKHVKDLIKEKLKHKEGTRLGVLFKAMLKLVPTHRLNQKALKENEPEVFDEYNEDVTDERVTFELR